LINKSETPSGRESIASKAQFAAYALVVALIGGLPMIHFDQVSARAATANPDKITPDVLTVSNAAARRIDYGVYDPASLVRSSAKFNVEHIFVAWQAPDVASIDTKIGNANADGRSMMITVEPFTHAADWRSGGETLFRDIQAGQFDREIDWICAKALEIRGRKYVRWGHEMEDVDGRYPWARADAAGYRDAYTYFVERCRRILPDASYVWSPKGHSNLRRYYPGGKVVDIVGLPVWGLEKMDRDFWRHPRSFAETFAEKYHRVDDFARPVIVAELGVSGSTGYKHAWYREIFDASAATKRFPLLQAIHFFNDKEPHHWPLGYGSPDWRFDGKTLAELRKPGR
jgi:endoglucanase